MTTIADIGKKLGVSKSTVSKALNNAPDISETLRKTIVETAVEMGYSKLRQNKKEAKKICILIENMDYTNELHFGYHIIIGFRQMAEPAGYQVDVVPIDNAMQRVSGFDAFMLQNHYLGAFILGMTLNDPWMKDLQSSRTPAVLYDNYVPENPSTCYVGIDNSEGMNLAVKYLKGLGHRKIGYLSTSLGSYITQIRHRAFFSALKQNGLKSDPRLAGISYYVSECVQKHVPKLLEQGVTAIICCHDQMANAAMVQCRETGHRVPEDISIVGFDDLPMCAYTEPPLTTVRQDQLLLGKCGFNALVSLMNEVPVGTLLLHASLVTRDSCGESNHSASQTVTGETHYSSSSETETA